MRMEHKGEVLVDAGYVALAAVDEYSVKVEVIALDEKGGQTSYEMTFSIHELSMMRNAALTGRVG